MILCSCGSAANHAANACTSASRPPRTCRRRGSEHRRPGRSRHRAGRACPRGRRFGAWPRSSHTRYPARATWTGRVDYSSLMRIAIAGGGMVGLMLARLLRAARVRAPCVRADAEGKYVPRVYMLGYQGFPPFEELGVLHQIREAGWDIAPREDGSSTVAIAVNVGTVCTCWRATCRSSTHIPWSTCCVPRMVGSPASWSRGPRAAVRSNATWSSRAMASTPRCVRWPASRPSSTTSRMEPFSGWRDHEQDVIRDAVTSATAAHRHARMAARAPRLAHNRQGRA